MKIATRDFGEMELDSSEVIRFRQPIFGFEELHDYVLLYDDSMGSCFIWLQSVQERDVCFVMVDPAVLPSSYSPVITPEVQQQLELAKGSDAVVRVIAVIPDDFMAATVNLKSPIVINPVAHCAAQVMLDDDYPIRAPIIGSGEGDQLSC